MVFDLKKLIFILSLSLMSVQSQDIDVEDLVLDDPEDIKLLMDEFSQGELEKKKEPTIDVDKINDDLNLEDLDDLESLKTDIGELELDIEDDGLDLSKDLSGVDFGAKKKNETKIVKKDEISNDEKALFDIGKEERELLEIASKMKGQIENDTWNEIASQTSQSSYTVVKGDWLWKISKRLFGSGFYYGKIWSLNSYITNPHEIEPGMVLVFTTGTESQLPSVSVQKTQDLLNGRSDGANLSSDEKKRMVKRFGTDALPDWLEEREGLKKDGAYIQYATPDTIEDLTKISDQSLITEYESYDPPENIFSLDIPSDEYDELGFDRNSRVTKDFKEGFHLNTFISTNIVQDFGKVVAAIDEKGLFSHMDKVFVQFDEEIDLAVGDRFSIYNRVGMLDEKASDRKGYRYDILGSIQLIRKHDDKWETKVIESSGAINRGDRITVYTPKIERITRTFNERLIEALLVGCFNEGQTHLSFGDVVYLDRGRADGVEMGNVFEVYGFKDRGTKRNITPNPTYKNGELTVISVTDNFTTALVSKSNRDFKVGDIAITKTKKAAAKDLELRQNLKANGSRLDKKALDELDVELNLDDLNDDLLDKADKIRFTEDELAELERQEREKSIISDEEKDLKALERLEKEISSAEAMLNEAKFDEDRLLEDQNLDNLEKKYDQSYAESIEEIEENFGKLYIDEDINDQNNPYGLTEFDLEEIDELLNNEGELEARKQ